jgi:DNA-binding CsgD family transcriptional regulator
MHSRTVNPDAVKITITPMAQTLSNAFLTLINDSGEQYLRYEAEKDYTRITESLRIVERIYIDSVLMLCNRSHPTLQYVGENCSTVFGLTSKEFKTLTIRDFLDSIHPDDLSAVHKCFDFINTTAPYNPITHRFVMNYRFRNKSGNYFHIRDEKLAIDSGDNKFIYFVLFRDITAQEKFFQVKLDIYQQGKNDFNRIYSYQPRQSDREMTPRQHEITRLIVQGFSTQEIADKLHVSVSTIKNHKQVLFRKVNVKSNLELINFTMRQEVG